MRAKRIGSASLNFSLGSDKGDGFFSKEDFRPRSKIKLLRSTARVLSRVIALQFWNYWTNEIVSVCFVTWMGSHELRLWIWLLWELKFRTRKLFLKKYSVSRTWNKYMLLMTRVGVGVTYYSVQFVSCNGIEGIDLCNSFFNCNTFWEINIHCDEEGKCISKIHSCKEICVYSFKNKHIVGNNRRGAQEINCMNIIHIIKVICWFSLKSKLLRSPSMVLSRVFVLQF